MNTVTTYNENFLFPGHTSAAKDLQNIQFILQKINLHLMLFFFFLKAFPTFLIFRAHLLSLIFLPGVSNAAAESRCSCCLLALWLFWFLHLPGGHGAFCGVFVSGWRSHISRTHLCIGVLLSEHNVYTTYNIKCCH